MNEPNQFDLDFLQSLSSVKQIIFHEKLRSTNDLGIELAKSNSLQLPTLIVAKHQTHGRGQPGRTWSSAPGSLTFSLVMGFRLTVPQLLPLGVGLAVAEAIEQVASLETDNPGDNPPVDVKLKWPNDLLVDKKKLGGILVESLADRHVAVIGIGLNVNNPAPRLDGETNSLPAISLSEHLKIPIPVSRLLATITDQIVATCQDLEVESQSTSLLHAINQRLAYVGESVQFDLPNGQRTVGRIQSVAASGAIILENNGQTRQIVSGTMSVEPNSTDDGP